MSSGRDKERKEERQNQNQRGGWVGAPTTWVDNSPAPSPIGGGNKTATVKSGQPSGYVRDNPGHTNYHEPVGAGWDKGATATSLSSMGDEKQGGPNHVVVQVGPTHTESVTDNDTGTGTAQPHDQRAENRAFNKAHEAMRLSMRRPGAQGGTHQRTYTGPITRTADQSPQGRRVTSPNTGALPTLSQKTVTQVQPKAATETKEDKAVCKARPKDNRPKGGGGGGSKRFVPWCS